MAVSGVAGRVSRKELGLFFSSPSAVLFLASFAVACLFIFFWVESFFARNIADVRPLFEWLPLLLVFLCATITMRMWSEERQAGTLEHVLTQPVSLWRFVLGKFRACFTLLLLALVSTLPLPLTAALLGELDWGPVLAGYLASALLGGAYLAAGLFVSSRTDNPMVSLIGATGLSGALYLLGSGGLTGFFDQETADTLRLLGSGSRFDSIARGVIDARDLCYYLGLTVTFLALNVYSLERERWALDARGTRHRLWRATLVLLVLNLLAANLWLHRLPGLRLDITEGRIHSLSPASRQLLRDLQEPLLLRGYFSAKTHPRLAPLVEQLQDLAQEYEVAGQGKVRLEWINPEQSPLLEEEANRQYGIKATPFQVADRYQSTLSNAYFHLLVRYGDEFRTLGYRDLIDVQAGQAADDAPEVRLRNPEFDISRAIRDTLRAYRSGGQLFDNIERPVELIGYVSRDAVLPPALRQYRDALVLELERQMRFSEGRFSYRFIEPERADPDLLRQLEDRWGFSPMVSALGDDVPFYFYLTLADQDQVVQLPNAGFDIERFPASLAAGLRRFARDLTRSVALVLPAGNTGLAIPGANEPRFSNLETTIGRDYSILYEDLDDGEVDPAADILLVVAPQHLPETAIFAIDQFLMRGGTVVLATSPFSAETRGGQLQLADRASGLEPWLAHHGVSIAESLVLDPRNSPFPAPVLRRSGDYEFRDLELVNYPFFLDLRGPGLSRQHPVTSGLRQMVMPWASPIELAPRDGNRATPLLRASAGAWLSDDGDIMPRRSDDTLGGFEPDGARQTRLTGVVLEGRFESFFADRPLPEAMADAGEGPLPPALATPLAHSAESARLVLYSSNDFLADAALTAVARGRGTPRVGALDLLGNTLNWALQDEELMSIRSRGHFNRSLAPMDRTLQARIEYLNYALALGWLLLLGLVYLLLRWRRRRRYARELDL